jgi:tRNA-Thr(GGU) m(6)t(6)A37 methyltransferase TsaA
MLKIIGIVYSPFKEKFGIPRQPRLAKNIKATITISKEFNDPSYFKGLEDYSHLWLSFLFDNKENESPTVRPPRLGGKQRMGVFSTRTPHRPNSLGLSAVKLEKITYDDEIKIQISDHDLLDGTRIVDIKPYLAKWDIIEHANNGWVEKHSVESCVNVIFDSGANSILTKRLKEELVTIIGLDPRPVHQKGVFDFSTKIYSMKYDCFDIHWKMKDNQTAIVFKIDGLTEENFK